MMQLPMPSPGQFVQVFSGFNSKPTTRNQTQTSLPTIPISHDRDMDFPTSIFFLPDSRIFDVLKMRRPYPITNRSRGPFHLRSLYAPSETSKSYCLHRFSTATLSCAILSNLAVVIVGGFSLFLPPSTLNPQPYPSTPPKKTAAKLPIPLLPLFPHTLSRAHAYPSRPDIRKIHPLHHLHHHHHQHHYHHHHQKPAFTPTCTSQPVDKPFLSTIILAIPTTQQSHSVMETHP